VCKAHGVQPRGHVGDREGTVGCFARGVEGGGHLQHVAPTAQGDAIRGDDHSAVVGSPAQQHATGDRAGVGSELDGRHLGGRIGVDLHLADPSLPETLLREGDLVGPGRNPGENEAPFEVGLRDGASRRELNGDPREGLLALERRLAPHRPALAPQVERWDLDVRAARRELDDDPGNRGACVAVLERFDGVGPGRHLGDCPASVRGRRRIPAEADNEDAHARVIGDAAGLLYGDRAHQFRFGLQFRGGVGIEGIRVRRLRAAACREEEACERGPKTMEHGISDGLRAPAWWAGQQEAIRDARDERSRRRVRRRDDWTEGSAATERLDRAPFASRRSPFRICGAAASTCPLACARRRFRMAAPRLFKRESLARPGSSAARFLLPHRAAVPPEPEWQPANRFSELRELESTRASHGGRAFGARLAERQFRRAGLRNATWRAQVRSPSLPTATGTRAV
jgi:hypothetical protein